MPKTYRVEDTGNPINNALVARAYLQTPGVIVEQCEAEYEWTPEPCFLGKDTIWLGIGDREKIINYNRGWQFSNQGCCWELDSNRIENVKLWSRVLLGQQAQTVGHHGKNSKGDSNDVLRFVHAIGGSFCAYWWGNPGAKGNRCRFERCLFEAGRVGLLLMTGNGLAGQVADVIDSEFNIDWSAFPGAGGDIGSRPVGIWCRSGTTTAFRNKIRVKAHADCTLAAGVAMIAGNWDGSFPVDYKGFNWPLFNGYENDCQVNPNGCPRWGDLAQDIGILNMDQACNKGSGNNRALVKT